MYKEEKTVIIDGEPITAYRVEYDVNGNSRWVVHFLSIGVKLEDYGRIKGLTKYRAKWFGGGYVFQSVNLKHDLTYMVNLVKKFYENKK